MRGVGDSPPVLRRTGEVLWVSVCTRPKYFHARENTKDAVWWLNLMPACLPILWMGWGGRGREIAKRNFSVVSWGFFLPKGQKDDH